MSMQDRLNKIHGYIRIVDHMLTCVHRVEKQLTVMACAYEKSIETSKRGSNEYVIIELHDITFESLRNHEGKLTYKEKTYPKDYTELDNKLYKDPCVNLDELLHTVCHLDEFMKHAIAFITKNEIEFLGKCVAEIKESTVADLL